MMATEKQENETTPPKSTAKPFRLPPLFPSTVVVEAFRGLLHPKTVLRKLRELNAIEADGQCFLVKPDVLQDNYPRIYRECCRILVERDQEKGAA